MTKGYNTKHCSKKGAFSCSGYPSHHYHLYAPFPWMSPKKKKEKMSIPKVDHFYLIFDFSARLGFRLHYHVYTNDLDCAIHPHKK